MAEGSPEPCFGYTREERRALFEEFRGLYGALKARLEGEGRATSLEELDARSRAYHELIGEAHRELRKRWEMTHEQLEAIIREGLQEDW